MEDGICNMWPRFWNKIIFLRSQNGYRRQIHLYEEDYYKAFPVEGSVTSRLAILDFKCRTIQNNDEFWNHKIWSDKSETNTFSPELWVDVFKKEMMNEFCWTKPVLDLAWVERLTVHRRDKSLRWISRWVWASPGRGQVKNLASEISFS